MIIFNHTFTFLIEMALKNVLIDIQYFIQKIMSNVTAQACILFLNANPFTSSLIYEWQTVVFCYYYLSVWIRHFEFLLYIMRHCFEFCFYFLSSAGSIRPSNWKNNSRTASNFYTLELSFMYQIPVNYRKNIHDINTVCKLDGMFLMDVLF